ncbi:DNA-binding protein [Bosea sp. (in: a-proteobacteria)]|uniref:DNA-binding protein n=1 Tax=Bosea sp. (in: a-proteobacteria) TaxID=1871050 RepID=UPI00121B37C4|nr:DNA-binding protein [Bosea sp. (in: a-proteobacteria)]TAJ31816.1 MAG: hypothetical protein EPO59_06860 [Bosea sp. (in: a-proteobacteria)]
MTDRRDDLTEAEVHAICDGLDADGIEPSVRKIREQAERGSHSTITKYLRTWIAQRGRVVLPMPDEVNKHMSAVGAGIWRIAIDHATGVFDRERGVLQSEVAELQDSVTWTEADLEQERKAAAIVKAAAARSEQDAESARLQVAALEGKVAGLEAEAAVLRDTIADLQAMIGLLRSPNPDRLLPVPLGQDKIGRIVARDGRS